MLEEILAFKRQQVLAEKRVEPLRELEAKLPFLEQTRGFHQAIKGHPLAVIAEIKKASPSAGAIRKDLDICGLALTYEKAGAAAISVLTETRYFNGNLDFLPLLREIVNLPLLRKDFIVDQYQIYQSRVYGADAILLIVAALGNKLGDFLRTAADLGLDALVEVHSIPELDIALESGCRIIGVNNRNLKNMITDIKVTEELAPRVPAGVTLISESGIKTGTDVKRLKKVGARGILVGEALVKCKDPIIKIQEFLEAMQ